MPDSGTMAREHVLVCAGLRRSFDDLVAVDDIGFHIDAGEIYGLLGPNGAGKTTTISMVVGLLEPDAGQISVAGQTLTTRSVGSKAAIGYVPQDLAIYPDLTGRENLAFFARLYGIAGPARKVRIGDVLGVVGLADRADDPTKEYSGGMKRRLNIAIALLHRPKLLVLDEPTVGVDPQSRNAILDNVRSLAGAGMAVLYTTHYMEEAEHLCDRVGIIDHGKLIVEGTRRELVSLVGERDHITLGAAGDLVRAGRALAELPGVIEASARDDGIDLVVDDARARLPEILNLAASGGATVKTVEVAEPDLEAVFLHLTGRALRD